MLFKNKLGFTINNIKIKVNTEIKKLTKLPATKLIPVFILVSLLLLSFREGRIE
jgi:hypothetical protein